MTRHAPWRVMSNDEISFRQSAHHEAGHCVVGLRLGLPIDSVTLRFQPRMFQDPLVDGHAHVGNDDSAPKLMALVVAGGPAAEAWWNQVACGADFAHCHEWMQRSNREDAAALAGYVRAGRLKQRPIVTRAVELVTANWAAVAQIAEALMAHGHLSGQQVYRLAGI